MSYILDALKKLEHDKSRKSRGDGVINISGALFEHERPKPVRSAGWKIALAVTVAVLVTFTATWQFFHYGKGRENPSPRTATLVPQAPPTPAVVVEAAPPPPPPVSPPEPVRQTRPAAPSAPAKATTVRTPSLSSLPHNEPAPAVTATEDAAAELTLKELRKRTKERKDQASPPGQNIAAPADIKLSGIAWQEERRARRAVVNGFLMQEGGAVSGARITDIFQDRVRFSLSGRTFEIPLNSSGTPLAGK